MEIEEDLDKVDLGDSALITSNIIDLLKAGHEGGPDGYKRSFDCWCSALQGCVSKSDNWFSSSFNHKGNGHLDHLLKFYNNGDDLIVGDLISILDLTEAEQKKAMKELGLPMGERSQFCELLGNLKKLSNYKSLGTNGAQLSLTEFLNRSFAIQERLRQRQ